MKVPNEELLKTHPHLADFLPFLDVLNSESPRGAVLVACSHLEILLEEILRAFLVEGKPTEKLLTGFNAPLGNLSSKITAVNALGLTTTDEGRECDLLRRIRNRFAHDIHVNFEDESIISLCDELKFRAKSYGDVNVSAQGAFSSAAVGLISRITNRAHYAKLERLSLKAWPV